VLAFFFFGAARFLAATLLVTFSLAGEAMVAPSPATALAPLAAFACIAVASVPKTALAAAVEAAFAVAAALATSTARTLVLLAALFPAARMVSRFSYGALALHFRARRMTFSGLVCSIVASVLRPMGVSGCSLISASSVGVKFLVCCLLFIPHMSSLQWRVRCRKLEM
jgi:hypothetical protein